MKKLLVLHIRGYGLTTLYVGTMRTNRGSYFVGGDKGEVEAFRNLHDAIINFSDRVDGGAGSIEVFTRLAQMAEAAR